MKSSAFLFTQTPNLVNIPFLESFCTIIAKIQLNSADQLFSEIFFKTIFSPINSSNWPLITDKLVLSNQLIFRDQYFDHISLAAMA